MSRWLSGRRHRASRRVAPDGRPTVEPADRAAWRAWLIANHATEGRASGCSPSDRRAVAVKLDYEAAVEEALCVGWIDSKGSRLDDERNLQWYAPRSPRSGWSARTRQGRASERRGPHAPRRPRCGRGGQAPRDVDDARRRRGRSWCRPIVAAALDAQPPARANWEAFSPSARRRQILGWIVQAKRPETRAARIAETAMLAARNEKANQPRRTGLSVAPKTR